MPGVPRVRAAIDIRCRRSSKSGAPEDRHVHDFPQGARSVRGEHDRLLIVRQMIPNTYIPLTLDLELSGQLASFLRARRCNCPRQAPVLGKTGKSGITTAFRIRFPMIATIASGWTRRYQTASFDVAIHCRAISTYSMNRRSSRSKPFLSQFSGNHATNWACRLIATGPDTRLREALRSQFLTMSIARSGEPLWQRMSCPEIIEGTINEHRARERIATPCHSDAQREVRSLNGGCRRPGVRNESMIRDARNRTTPLPVAVRPRVIFLLDAVLREAALR